MSKPQHYQPILLAITGLSPQVVTETLFALHKQARPVPTRIVIITTLRGAQEVSTHLLKEGKLQQLCDDYQLPAISLAEKDIIVVPDASGKPMNDAISQQDHCAMSDFICKVVRQLTSDPNTAIHASIAGGRKTMTFLLGYAMSLFGRSQDTLSHTLVTEGYESSQFFYPTPYSQQIYLRNGSKDAKDAEVILADIPFVRLRQDFPSRLLDGTESYSETVAWLNIDPNGQPLTLNILDKSVTFCGQSVQLRPAEFTFYHWFCQRAQEEQVALAIPFEGIAEPEYAKGFLDCYQWFLDDFQLDELLAKTFTNGMEKSYFEERKSRVNTMLVHHFGERIGKHITIQNQGKTAGRSLFAIAHDAELIQILYPTRPKDKQ